MHIKIILSIFLFIFSVSAGPGWVTQNSGTNKPIFDIYFPDNDNGWAASITNTVLRTSDGGNTWYDQNPAPSVNYYGIFFLDSLKGWAFGDGSVVNMRYTTDGGITWPQKDPGVSYTLYDMYFVDENNAWLVGGRHRGFNIDPIRYIINTADAGSTWVSQLYDYDEVPLHAVHFFDESTGCVVGDAGSIFYTDNAGSTWTQQASGTLTHLRGVHLISEDTIWIVGINGMMLSTTDGGVTWNIEDLGYSIDFSDIQFINSHMGWVVGGTVDSGVVLKTMDGGDTWYPQVADSTPSFLYAVHFTDSVNGWVSGYEGTIIHTSTGGDSLTGIVEDDNREDLEGFYSIEENIVGTFSGTITIRYSLEREAHVLLKVYDVTGKEIETLVNRFDSKGNYNITWNLNTVVGGIYFYRLTAVTNNRQFSKTGKMVLLK